MKPYACKTIATPAPNTAATKSFWGPCTAAFMLSDGVGVLIPLLVPVAVADAMTSEALLLCDLTCSTRLSILDCALTAEELAAIADVDALDAEDPAATDIDSAALATDVMSVGMVDELGDPVDEVAAFVAGLVGPVYG